MKLKIVSDGTTMFTKVVNAETNEPLMGVVAIKWEVNIDKQNANPEISYRQVHSARAVLIVENVEIEAIGEVVKREVVDDSGKKVL